MRSQVVARRDGFAPPLISVLALNPALVNTICNNASQYGENPGDRRQGQFQINVVSPGFSTITIAAADITLIPSRPYRLVFKGVGTHFTA
jgi:hypothetical protein